MPCAHPASERCPRCASPATLDDAPRPAAENAEGDQVRHSQLDTHIPGDEPAAAAPLGPGARIGRYVLIERIGHGGMGVVYMAHDPSLERLVAVKVLRDTRGDGSQGQQMRLLREAQAMAQLSHPNIVPVYDVGREGDGIYLAMELVRGDSLNDWIRGKHDWRETLAMFIAAGQGLLAAHRVGLVHRDFKPHNVLIGSDGRPRVADFGIARFRRTEDGDTPSSSGPSSLEASITVAGSMMGSPGYMAPEQYTGAETSPATDQFAFCVSLYEGLYGKRPFSGPTVDLLQQATTRGQVPPPPADSKVPAWVHRILVRGLAPDPAMRHESMTSLLDALARDPAVVRKRRLVVGAVATTLVGVTAALVWLASQQARLCSGAEAKLTDLWDDAVKARAEAAFTATGKPFAAHSWSVTRTLMDAFAQRWVTARTQACEATRRREQTEQQMLLRYSCLDRRLDELGELGRAFANANTDVVAGAISAASRLAPPESCADVKSLEDRRQPPPELRPTVERLAQQLAQGRALTLAGRFVDAREKIEPAAAQGSALDLPALQAEAWFALAELELKTQHFPEARVALEKAARAAEVAGDDAAAARILGTMVSLFGWRLEKPDQARTLATLASGIVERIGGDTLIEATIAEGLGDAEWQAGNRHESLGGYRKALALYQKAQGDESLDVARLHSSIGWVLSEMGQLADARAAVERSRGIREKLVGNTHPALIESWSELGNLAAAMGDDAEEARCYRNAVELARQVHGDNALPTVRARLNLAVAALREGDDAEAERLLDQVDRFVAADPSTTTTMLATLRTSQIQLATNQGRLADAVRLGRLALDDAERGLGAEHPTVAELSRVLAVALNAQGQHADALTLIKRYLASEERLGAAAAVRYADGLVEKAVAFVGLGRSDAAVEELERAVAIIAAAGGTDRKLLARARLELADAVWRAGGDKGRARALAGSAREGFAQLGRQSLEARAAAWLAKHPAQ